MLQVKYIQFSPRCRKLHVKEQIQYEVTCLAQQDDYMSLKILGCTVNCRFRFADCPLIYCVYEEANDQQYTCELFRNMGGFIELFQHVKCFLISLRNLGHCNKVCGIFYFLND